MAKATSEDRLLAVIEDHDAEESRVASLKQEKGKRFTGKGKFSSLLKTRVLNKFLVVLCTGITLYFVFDFYYRNVKLGKHFSEIKERKGRVVVEEKNSLVLDVDLKEGLKLAQERDIFSLIPPKKKSSAPVRSEVDISELLQNLKVVAIIWDRGNSQVMVEDVRGRRTYSLIEGDIINEFRVKSINKNFVVLEKEGKEWTIR